MDNSEHDVLTYMAFPRQHRTKLHSSNPIERLNKRGETPCGCRRQLSQRSINYLPDHDLRPSDKLHHLDGRDPCRSDWRAVVSVSSVTQRSRFA